MSGGQPAFSANAFVGGPFWDCPSCRESETFGVFLTVNSSDYERRCTNCGHRIRYDLPALNKEIIYVDQFAISNMASAKGSDERWRDLFARLRRLVYLQLVACPASLFHYEESVVWTSYEATRSFYEGLSAGLSFHDYEHIRRHQIFAHAQMWARGEGKSSPAIAVMDALAGDPSSWPPRLEIRVRIETSDDDIEELRRDRDSLALEMEEIFGRWQSDKPAFDEVYEEEVRAYGQTVLRILRRQLSSLDHDDTQEVLSPGWGHTANVIVAAVRGGLEAGGISADSSLQKACEYLLSDDLRYLPFNEINATMYASLARKAGSGQKKPPTRGLANDVRMVSSLLPYCDAMFLDNECAAYLAESPASDLKGKYATRVFSLSSFADFVDYLDSIEARATDDHRRLVEGVYGPLAEPLETNPEGDDHATP